MAASVALRIRSLVVLAALLLGAAGCHYHGGDDHEGDVDVFVSADTTITEPDVMVALFADLDIDGDVDVDEYEWFAQSGPAIPDFTHPFDDTTWVTFPEPGTYVIVFEVLYYDYWDGDHETAWDSITIEVLAVGPG